MNTASRLRYGEVKRVDRTAKQLLMAEGEPLSYDKLILTNGAHPFVPPIAGLDFSVLIGILVVQIVIGGFLVRTLLDLAHRMR